MDFQAFVNTVSQPCAVLSVEKAPDGTWGEIRIVCANPIYKETMGPLYYDNMLYHELVPKDLKFEDFCFRAAVGGQRMHAYVDTPALGCWTDQLMIPLASDRPDLGYCQFMFEFTKHPESQRMADVSIETASAVIRACIALMRPAEFEENVRDVLEELLDYAEAYACRIMLVDHEKRQAINFCEQVRQGALVHPLDSRLDGTLSYEIVRSWEDMIGVSNAVIVKSDEELDELETRNPAWVESMRMYGINSLVLIPLRRGKVIIGYLYVVNSNTERVVEIKELVELLSFFLGAEIANFQLMEQLSEMSRVDALTGLNNRFAMLQRVRYRSSR